MCSFLVASSGNLSVPVRPNAKQQHNSSGVMVGSSEEMEVAEAEGRGSDSGENEAQKGCGDTPPDASSPEDSQ